MKEAVDGGCETLLRQNVTFFIPLFLHPYSFHFYEIKYSRLVEETSHRHNLHPERNIFSGSSKQFVTLHSPVAFDSASS
jgi:hypothetical protein